VRKGIAQFALTAFIAIWALLGLVNPVAAQDVDSGDVEDLAGSITDKDPQQVVDALQGDFNTDHLPDGFSEAVAEGAEGTPEAGMDPGAAPDDPFGAAETEGYVGSVAFTLTADESEEEDADEQAEPPAEGTAPVEIPSELQSFDLNVIYLAVFESEDTATAAFDEAREEGALEDQGMEVEENEEFGVPGIAASTSLTEEGMTTAFGMNVAQVGNVLVIGISAEYDMTGAELDTDEVKETARNLTASGILHLDESVEDL
jgi:hypothetical protein